MTWTIFVKDTNMEWYFLFCLDMIYKRKQQQENQLAQETDTCSVYLFGGKERILCLSK